MMSVLKLATLVPPPKTKDLHTTHVAFTGQTSQCKISPLLTFGTPCRHPIQQFKQHLYQHWYQYRNNSSYTVCHTSHGFCVSCRAHHASFASQIQHAIKNYTLGQHYTGVAWFCVKMQSRRNEGSSLRQYCGISAYNGLV